MIDSLREYVIIHQDQYFVQVHSKQPEGAWLQQDYRSREATARLRHLDAGFALAELYATCTGLV